MFYDGRVEINAAVLAIETFLETYDGIGEHHVRPSGDNVDVIKVWIEVRAADAKAVAAACETAIRKAIPAAAAFKLQIRAETGAS